jgi:hypothetical protein
VEADQLVVLTQVIEDIAAALKRFTEANTLLPLRGNGRHTKDLRHPLAALRMSAALAADRVRDGSPKGGDAKRLRAQHDSPTPKGARPLFSLSPRDADYYFE